MKTDLNFLVSYKMTNKHLMLKAKVSYLLIAISIVVVAIIAGITLYLVAMNITDKVTIINLKADSVKYDAATQEVNKLNQELTSLQETQVTMQKILMEIEISNMLNKTELDTIFNSFPEDVRVVGITYSQSVMFLKCEATNKNSPSTSAEKLEAQGISASVSYYGFTSKKDEATTTFEFALTCLIGEAQ